ncbi:MAG: 4Fe-4S binding protein, partial [Planctomycetota bacterium]
MQNGETQVCGTDDSGAVSLPVVPPQTARGPRLGRSRNARWRAAVLITVHLAIIAHVVQWRISGTTVSPIEPSEAMETLETGRVNAGFLFFAAAILSTLLLGRFVCGWGCHVIAVQDFCAWLLRKLRIHPKPLRSRVLLFAPLVLAIYMFVWPSVHRRLWPEPQQLPLAWTNHLITTSFWATFPGPVTAVLTFAICGFAGVYVLGSKGFCTYGCPYGAIFGFADTVAPGRIRVTEDCRQCGHCTATCTSNVNVAAEVRQYGMVVDPGCMKTLDCVSVCPNDALYWGWGRPALRAKPRTGPAKPRRLNLTWIEELAVSFVFAGSFFAFRGLYDEVPLLMAMGIAGVTAYALLLAARMFYASRVKLQTLHLKRAGRWLPAGRVYIAAVALVLLFTVYSGLWRCHRFLGSHYYARTDVGEAVWTADANVLGDAPPEVREAVRRSFEHLRVCERWALYDGYRLHTELAWLYLLQDRPEDARRHVLRSIERKPRFAGGYHNLARLDRRAGRPEQAREHYAKALQLNPDLALARSELGSLLIAGGNVDAATGLLREGLARKPGDLAARFRLASLSLQHGDLDDAQRGFEHIVKLDPTNKGALLNLGALALRRGQPAQ